MLLETFQLTIEKFKMLQKGDRVVIAVSGGPDSVALVYLFKKIEKKWHLSLHLAHLNHSLRDQESDTDSLFVKNLAERLKLPYSIETRKVKEYAKKCGLSLEEAARILRYDFLLKVAQRNSANKIALGHNKDDQAETVLMRFLRGSGISGLRAIPAVRSQDRYKLIRPLIESTRKEINAYLKAKKISFRVDSSNLNDVFYRNRIRNTLIPLLEKDYNPNIKEILVNFAENITDDCDFLEKTGQNKFKTVRANTSAAKVALKVKEFSSLHKALQKLVTRLAIKELKGNTRKIEYRHWKELEGLAFKRPKESIVDLPGEISVRKSEGKLVFYKRSVKSS
ncbi:MAG: tRNA lysidine(34) synthetase TilS [Candidatus Omnitrophica bacterium]|nr:tRNA lysidine(34) synthetase TilS [Candidatus Omnitrophota bacterium]